jgi:N-methylhydantoinase A
VQTVNLTLSGIDSAALQNRLLAEVLKTEAMVRETGLAVTEVETILEADMHYVGQTHTIAVRLPGPLVDEVLLRATFEAAYLKNFGRVLPGIAVRLVNLRVAAIGRRPRFDLTALAPGPGASMAAADRGARNVWFNGWQEARIFDRLLLPVGAEIFGPAILEQPDATIVIDPGLAANVDRFGNVILVRA